MRQLLDLAPAWSDQDYFFITENTALGRSIADTHQAHFVEHVALGQARLGSPWKMLKAGVINALASACVIIKERPDVVVTTGAGSVFFSVFWSRLLGAKVILIDSLARRDSLSAFARLAAPFSHHKVVQSDALARFWPDALVFDPIRLLPQNRPKKKSLLFATVGATLPFDRLVESVAALKARGEILEDVLIQTGIGGVKPEGLRAIESLPFEEMTKNLREADIVICHGGTGSLITALREGCRVVAMPRLFRLGEHYDDHQEEITAAFEARGLIQTANNLDELAAALRRARDLPPVVATSEPVALTRFVRETLQGEAQRRRRVPVCDLAAIPATA